ncbi:kinetochore-associated protein 1 [Eublepharis macularius]|uniref:Kinetochore-associated protein 1 n=1 Tax=Eublepharis macularius TaxID=481883 RepID=A0AA97K9G1_EUBMA|nr:kinetochore-associated protein 1 [Eublepharis macularius]
MWDDIQLLPSHTESRWLNIECASPYGPYEAHTVIKITSPEKILSNPRLQAYTSSDGFIVVADRTVLVLDTCQSLQILVHFETEVDIVGLCQEGRFLVVGERSGNLHLIHVPSKQTLVTRMLVEKSSHGRTYLNLNLEKHGADEGTYHAFILTENGVFCIMKLPLGKTQEAIDILDLSTAKKLQEQMETCFISTEEYHTTGCLTSVTKLTANKIALIIGGSGDCVISVWEADPNKKTVSLQNIVDSSMIKAVKRLQVVGSLLYILDDENVLSMWDVYSLTMIWDWPSIHIEELLLIQGSVSLKLVALTEPDGDKQIRNIVVFSLPAMQQLYSLEVTNISSLSQSGINTDTIYFLEGVYENNQKSSDIPVSFLVMRCLTEAVPEDRLSRLLHNHKFTEAENFALLFGLDVELVYKIKVSSILERLASESVDHDGQSPWLELVAEVKETLNKTKDNQFVVEYCINTPWPTYEMAQEMLSYAKNRISKRDGITTGITNWNPASLTQVLQAQARLTTFYGAFGPRKFSGTAWLEFLENDDLFKDILLQLKEGNLSSACFLWQRHQADFQEHFSVDMLENLLDTIPATVCHKELCVWFKEKVIPFIRLALPQGQKIIAKWLEQQARNLEVTDKANWPENGLEMAQLFFTSSKSDEAGVASSGCWVLWDDKCEEVCRLAKLFQALQGLVELYRKYSCKLTLREFEKENADTIVFRMFDKVLAAELIPATLEKFIEPYMRQHELQKDEILLQYIKDLVERYCTRSTSVFETTWEAKAIAVLDCISDMDLIFEGVLAIMHGAGVPWSPGVERLVQQYLEMDHAKVKLLQEGYKLMEMKTILLNYGIRDTNLLNDKQGMLRLAKYIVKRGTTSSLEDALKVANVYMLPTAEVYIVRIMDLIDKDKGEEVLDLLKTLHPTEAVEMAERTVICGKLLLEHKMFVFKEPKMQLSMKKMLVDILSFLLNIQKENFAKKAEYEADLDVFKTLVALQENFDTIISTNDYENPTLRSQLLEDHVKTYEKIQGCGKTPDDVSSKDSHMKKPLSELRFYRLASLLQKSELEAASLLVLKALDAEKVEEALRICRDFYERHHNEQAGELLFLACQKLCHTFELDSIKVTSEELSLPALIHNMACQASSICSPDLLLDVVELCKFTSFAHEIYDKCQIEDIEVVSETTSGADKNPYTEWTFDDFFTEDGAVLDPPAVLPVAYEITSYMLPLTGKDLCVPLRAPICVLLDNLQESNQHELSLGLITNSLGSVVQHVIGNSMDANLAAKLHTQKTLHDAVGFLTTVMHYSESKIKNIAMALLYKVFNSRHIDHSLALGYCSLLPKEMIYQKLWDIINKTGQNYSKVLAVSRVGAHLARCYDDMEEKQKFEELIIDAEWGIQLGQFKISFQNVFRTPPVRKKELLRIMVQNPYVKTDLILKYCRSFQLNSDAALQLYIEALLQNASTSQVEGESSRDTGKQPPASVVARATEIIPLLRSTNNLVVNLCALLHKLDPYDYETIESLLMIIEKAGGEIASIPLKKALMLIEHLKSYKRISAPGDLEHEYVFKQDIPLSPAAQARLPFHLIFFRTAQCFWNIITPEINEESFPKIFLISKLMKVSLDTLHMCAAKCTFQERLKPKTLEWTRSGSLLVVDKEIAKIMMAIRSYLLHVTCPEWSVALAYKMAQELQTGPIKVQALNFCLYLVEKWLTNNDVQDESREKAREYLRKIQVEYNKQATEAVLIAHSLNTKEHWKLIGKPAHLVVLLYQHSSIAERLQNPAGNNYPDIHAAAKEIARINNLDMKTIWDMLLEKWLCPSEAPTDRTSEMVEKIEEEDEGFKRVLYLLQLQPADNCFRILYECATSTTSPIGENPLTFAHRSRALKCLIYWADSSTVELLFRKPIEKVRVFLKTLMYLAEFEILNIPYTYESFRSTPKEGMIKGLWRNHSHEPRAVKLMTELSLEYKVCDAQLWNGLLQKMLDFNMIHYLRNVLAKITRVHSLWQIPNFSRAWQNVILAPLHSVSCPPSPSELEACCTSFRTLLNCPVQDDLDLIGIAKKYVELQLLALALGCLWLIPQLEKRNQQIQDFLASHQLDTILHQVEEHMSHSETASFASQIRHLILDYTIHQRVKSSGATELLKLEKVGADELKRLVKCLADENRIDDAASLIKEYLKGSGNPVSDQSPSSDVVKMFLWEV